MGEQENDGKEAVTIGRPVTHDNVLYGRGVYRVTPDVARALRAKNATASVAQTMRGEKERREREEMATAENSPSHEGGTGGDKGAGGGVIIGGDSGSQSGSPGNFGTGGVVTPSASGERAQGSRLSSAAGSGEDLTGGESSKDEGSGEGVEGLKGKLPDDFPARGKLAAGNPEAGIEPVTTYEALTKLTGEQLDSIPGIGEKLVEQIGLRLFADAQKKSDE